MRKAEFERKKKGIIKKITGIILTGIMAVTALTGCGQSSAQTTNESTQAGKDGLKTVRILTPGMDYDGKSATLLESLKIADAQGYIEKELKAVGYKAEYTGFASAGVGVNEALAAGKGDIAVYGDFPAITYITSNGDASIFGVTSARQQFGIIAQGNIKSVKDLKGKKIGTSLGTVAYKYLVHLLEQNGLSEKDVQIVNATTDLTSMFISKDIDAIAQNTQMLYYIENQTKSNIFALSGNDETLTSNSVLLGKNDFLKENPDVPKAILKALNEAQQYAAANPEEVYKVFAEKSAGAVTEEQFKKDFSFDTTFAYWKPEITEAIEKNLQESADFMAQKGYTGKKITISDYIYKNK